MKTTNNPSGNKRIEKNQVNIAWNSRLYFQIGIIVSCLIVFFVMQASFELKPTKYAKSPEYGIEEPAIINYKIDVVKPTPLTVAKIEPIKPAKLPTQAKSSSLVEKDDTNDTPESQVTTVETPLVNPPEPTSSVTKVIEPIKSTEPSSILNVEYVPVYPGCEGLNSNAEKIECLSSQINSFIKRNFRAELLRDLEPNKIQKIYVQFKIDSQGYISDVRANSTNNRLKNEAMRVIQNLPKMKPGRQGDKNVDVLYTVPIAFNIQ